MNVKLIVILLLFILFSGCTNRVSYVERIQSFEVKPISNDNCLIQGENITIVVLTNGTELLNWEEDFVSFLIYPHSIQGEDKAYKTLYFAVEDFDPQIIRFNGAYQLRWSVGDDMWYEQGSKTMSYLDRETLDLSIYFNGYELSQISYSTFQIHFSNKEGTWEKFYNVKIYVT